MSLNIFTFEIVIEFLLDFAAGYSLSHNFQVPLLVNLKQKFTISDLRHKFYLTLVSTQALLTLMNL